MSKRTSKTTQLSHRQVDEALAALLKRGRPGDRLPAEPALAVQLGVSRATLREALRVFAERGLIVRRHGVGTFIAPPRPVIASGLESLESLESIASRIGLKIGMDNAVIEERPARPDELKVLGLESATLILSVARAIVADAQPVAYLVDVVPIEFLRKDELEKTFSGSVLDVLLKRGKPSLAYAHTNLMAAITDATLAKQLQVQRNTPLLKLEAQLYSQDGRIIDYSTGLFIPGYFRFHVIRRLDI